ncbi:MAG: hypothetical protein ABFR90_01175 [Planctomycetota bacterium]
MPLAYLRQNPIPGFGGDAATESAGKRSGKKKLSKSKLSLLLGSNLIVWVIFAVSIMDIKVFSMHGASMPRLPQKLAVSGIVYNETSPSAIISKQVYDVGDVVDGYTINRITRTEVEFQKGEEKILRQVR